MKKNCFLLITFCSFLLFVSCTKGYEMPHIPGVNVNQSDFSEAKELWEESKPENYSYTFFFLNRYVNLSYIVDVSVTEGHVSNYVLKEIDHKEKIEMTNEQWEEKIEAFNTRLETPDNLLIENIYAEIENQIEYEKRKFDEMPDCYYANFDFKFIERGPFMLSCTIDRLIMQEDLYGNGAHIEVKIEYFESE